jgi:hypothetical protein
LGLSVMSVLQFSVDWINKGINRMTIRIKNSREKQRILRVRKILLQSLIYSQTLSSQQRH